MNELHIVRAIWLLPLLWGLSPARAGTFYWDTDGSTTGNSMFTGANLGGSGLWSNAASNWWDTNLATLQPWTDGGDAVFWGTAGAVTATSVSPNSLTFKTTGYSITSGTMTMAGVPSNFTVDSNITATISSTIAGTNTMWKVGAGVLILANTNNANTATSSAGGWRVEGGGTLRISADGSLGAPLSSTLTDLQLNQSTIQAGASFSLDINRRTKINTNSSTNQGDAIIDTAGNVVTWYGSLQGGPGSLRAINSGPNPGLLILGTDKLASINTFGSTLPAGATNLTIQNGAIVQTSGTVTPTGGELGSETNSSGGILTIKLDNGQIRSESGGYTFQRNLVLGAGGGSLDTGAWIQTFFGGSISGSGTLIKYGTGTLMIDNPTASWAGGTAVHVGTLQLGQGGSNGLLPGTLANPSSVVIDAGATFKFNRGSNKSFFDVFSGGGGITVANSATASVRLVSDSTYTGPTTISSGTLMIGQGNAGEPGSIVSSVVNNSATLVFNRVEDVSYGGAISGTGALVKQAAGTLTLIGTNSYTGATIVSAGALLVNGVIGASAVSVTNGTLGGNGIIKGSVTVQAAGRLSPGASIGTLTISNSLTLSGVTVMELDAVAGTNDLLRGLTTVSYGGTLSLSNLAGSLGVSNAFKLFSANSYSGTFPTIVPATPGQNLGWNTNTLATDGMLRILSTAPVAIALTRCSPASQCFTLSWPADHIGWRLQAQTNSSPAGLGTNWVDVIEGTATNQLSLAFNRSVGSVFYRLRYP